MAILIILFMSTFYNLLSQCSSKKTSVINSNWMAKSQSPLGWDICSLMMMIDFLLQLLSFFCLSCQATMLPTAYLDHPQHWYFWVFGLGWALLFYLAKLQKSYNNSYTILLVKNVQTFIKSKKRPKKKEPPHDLGNLRSWNWIYDLVGSFCLSTILITDISYKHVTSFFLEMKLADNSYNLLYLKIHVVIK